MKRVYEVQLSRVVHEYRVVRAEADTKKETKSRARKLSYEKVEASPREYVTDWCDADHSNQHRIIRIKETK